MRDLRHHFDGAKVIVFLGDQLLVLRRDHTPGIPFPGCLDFPGGAREGDETPETCALREAFEEVGLRLLPDQLRFVHLRETPRQVSWFFAAHLPAEAVKDVHFGGEGAGWQVMAPDAFVAASDAIPHFRKILADYLAGDGAGQPEG